MARKLTPEEMERYKADFDPPAWATEKKPTDAPTSTEPPKAEKTTEAKKRKGNPHGRPASTTPRTETFTVRLTDAEKLKLEEAARMTGAKKTAVIVEGIDYVYSKALAEAKKLERQQAKEAE